MENNDTLISKSSFFRGDIFAKSIIVEGTVIGNLKATCSILIKEAGRVDGNIQAPSVYLEKGCDHEGAIYLDDSENILSSTNTAHQLESKRDNKVGTKSKQDEEVSRGQPTSGRSKNKLW